MIDGLPREFGNLLLSISLIDVDYCVIRGDFITIYDYIDDVLNKIVQTNKVEIYCKNIPEFYITRIITLIEHFNSPQYKSNNIMEKLVYIIYYHIQNRSNIVYLYRNRYGIVSIKRIKEVYKNLETIKPIIGNLLKLFFQEIDEHVMESRKNSIIVLGKEMEQMPMDLVKIIVDYMPDLYVLRVSQMF